METAKEMCVRFFCQMENLFSVLFTQFLILNPKSLTVYSCLTFNFSFFFQVSVSTGSISDDFQPHLSHGAAHQIKEFYEKLMASCAAKVMDKSEWKVIG